MPLTLNHPNYKIEMFDDPAFIQTADSPTVYDHVYQPDDHKLYRPISQHAIIVYQNNIKISSAILLAAAGGTSVTDDSVIIDGDNLITRCCDTVFSLTLPYLQLNWMVQVDWATCFSIHKYKDDFISWGEMSISRFDKNGKIIWKYSGADIFVSLDGSSPFEILDDFILLRDFNGGVYTISYDGKTINYSK